MIFAIKPFEIHDGDGIRTTVFFKGCSLRCQWCHNPESWAFEKEMLYDGERCISCMRCTALCLANQSVLQQHLFSREACIACGKCEEVCPQKAFEAVGMNRTAEEIAAEVLKDEIFMKGSGGGVTFSGGEPLLQADLCVEIAKRLKARGINLAIDTCGAVSRAAIDRILPYTDTFLFDLKAIQEEVHLACTGASNKQILENLRYIDSFGIPIEIRYPYVPTMNDGESQRIAEFVKTLKNVKGVRILGYHNYAEEKYSKLGKNYPLLNIPVPTKEELIKVAERMKETGVNALLY